ncbi:hypothetical protein SERLA73DRAFT_79817 [Serpula lacrymans var. lacrymans S7.3]|uniref:Uncharacterized protein n=2 Tax=Serpula lacrymans var. lacrymans TaxID=341189 RepID=F8QHP9_SERL3|nr:uncharacterized protein SERLADRAFT_436462 [Serpula lacrymans var. lacrymans S7.9]EGN92161.1 hypothetical protein SERLA73DRAFT_79817 [Serpula lacrymans var. lacrymans S7.3]EGO26655.1 hypothetical protein SERLADRAFT_436462 [Serpula lacrymans var. lacrymans S7.9]
MGVEFGKSKNEATGTMAKDLKSVLEEMCKVLFKTVEQMKHKAECECRHSKAPDYKQSGKLADKWIDSNQIKKIKPNVEELELSK